MTKQFARKLLKNPDEATVKQLFDGVKSIFWVDWREADDDIIRLAAKTMRGTKLAPVWNGQKLSISFRGELTRVPLKGEAGEQDITLRALNRAISPEFEIRFVRASDGGDTIAFMALDSGSWEELESEFGKKKLDETFTKVKRNSCFFSEEQSAKPAKTKKGKSRDEDESTIPYFRQLQYQLMTTTALAALRKKSSLSADTMPFTRPLFGDIVVAYRLGPDKASPYVTKADLRKHGLTPKELEIIAADISRRPMQDIERKEDGPLHRYSGNNIPPWIATNSIGFTSQAIIGRGHLVVAAFPRPSIVLFAPAADAMAIEVLRKEIAAINFNAPDSLSRHLYVWQEDHWEAFESLKHDPARDLHAVYKLASRYAWGFDMATKEKVKQDYQRAVRLYLQVADLTNADKDMFKNGSAVRCGLADKYENGLGVKQDYEKALYWYTKSAEQNDYIAQYSLGMMYKKGRGVPKDLKMARSWFTKSAAHGYANAKRELEKLDK